MWACLWYPNRDSSATLPLPWCSKFLPNTSCYVFWWVYFVLCFLDQLNLEVLTRRHNECSDMYEKDVTENRSPCCCFFYSLVSSCKFDYQSYQSTSYHHLFVGDLHSSLPIQQKPANLFSKHGKPIQSSKKHSPTPSGMGFPECCQIWCVGEPLFLPILLASVFNAEPL